MSAKPDTKNATVDELDGTLMARLGIVIVERSPERTRATMPVEGNRQPAGLLHGGASAALAETVGSIASLMDAGEERSVVGVDLNITHHRAVRDGIVVGTATPLHRGASTACYSVAITDQADRLVASARITCRILGPTRREVSATDR